MHAMINKCQIYFENILGHEDDHLTYKNMWKLWLN